MHHFLTRDDWERLAENPDFAALLRARRRFTVPATIFFIVYYLALPIGVAFAPALMRRPVWGPLTLAYTFAISQFVMAWILLAIYMRRAKAFDEMARRIVERAHDEYPA